MFDSIIKFSDRHFEESSPAVIAFSIFGLINYPLFFFYWHDFVPQLQAGFTLRLIATTLCLLLLLKKYWPNPCRKYFSLYWFCTLLYCLPFFGTLLFLQNQASEIWVQNIMLVLFLLILLTDWVMFTILLVVGVFLGSIFFISKRIFIMIFCFQIVCLEFSQRFF